MGLPFFTLPGPSAIICETTQAAQLHISAFVVLCGFHGVDIVLLEAGQESFVRRCLYMCDIFKIL